MNRRPCIGVWSPMNQIDDASRPVNEVPGRLRDGVAAPTELDVSIAVQVDWTSFAPADHGIGVTSASGSAPPSVIETPLHLRWLSSRTEIAPHGIARPGGAAQDPDRDGPSSLNDTEGPALPLHGLVIDTETPLDRFVAANGIEVDGDINSGGNGVCDGSSELSPRSFASILLEYLPVISAQRLNVSDERESFFERALAVEQLQHLFRPAWRVTDVVAFNARERFRAIVHDPKKHKLMGRIVAKGKDHARETLMREFSELYLSALAKPVTRRKHQSLFKHVDELLGDRLSEQEHATLQAVIDAYRQGEVERARPMEHLRDHILALGVRGLETQSYLFPSALEAAYLGLRTHQDASEG